MGGGDQGNQRCCAEVLGYSNHMYFFFQPTNFTNPVYATLYMGGHGSRHSLASTDEKRELLGRGPEDEIGDPLA